MVAKKLKITDLAPRSNACPKSAAPGTASSTDTRGHGAWQPCLVFAALLAHSEHFVSTSSEWNKFRGKNRDRHLG